MDITSTNDKVDMIRRQLGDFEYGDPMKELKPDLEDRPVEILPNGTKYKGQWIKGTEIREGKGTAIKPDGTMYEGWWKNNQACGRGRLIRGNGDIMDGIWEKNRLNGKSNVKYSSGINHVGLFKDHKIHGKGVEIGEDFKYIGNFEKGKRHGNGKFTTKDGFS